MLRRFAVKINFRLPNRTERKELLSVFLKRKGDASMTTLSAVEKKSDELYRKTLKSITSYESWILELKKSLMEQYVLSKDEVFELLAPLQAKQLEACV